MYVYICMSMCIYIYVYRYMCMHVYIYMNIYMLAAIRWIGETLRHLSTDQPGGKNGIHHHNRTRYMNISISI